MIDQTTIDAAPRTHITVPFDRGENGARGICQIEAPRAEKNSAPIINTGAPNRPQHVTDKLTLLINCSLSSPSIPPMMAMIGGWTRHVAAKRSTSATAATGNSTAIGLRAVMT